MVNYVCMYDASILITLSFIFKKKKFFKFMAKKKIGKAAERKKEMKERKERINDKSVYGNK